MKRYQQLFLIPITVLLASCIGEAIQGAKDSFNNKPEIRYANKRVTLTLRNEQRGELLAGQTVYLASDLHGVIAQTALQPDRSGHKISAKFTLPDNKPLGDGPACFYLTTGRGGASGVIPVENHGRVGFTNPSWESRFGGPSQIKGLHSANAALLNEQRALQPQLQQANQYLQNADAFVDGRCQRPPHATARPQSVYSDDIWELEPVMPHATCLNVTVPGVQPGSEFALISGDMMQFIYEHRVQFEAAQKLTVLALAGSENEIGYGKLQQIAQPIMQKEKRTLTCMALGECSIQDELYFGNPARGYASAVDSCVKATQSHLVDEGARYRKQLEQWENAPELAFKQCETQFNIAKQAPQRLQSIDNQMANNRQQLQRLEQQPKADSLAYPVDARKTACVPKS